MGDIVVIRTNIAKIIDEIILSSKAIFKTTSCTIPRVFISTLIDKH